MKIHISCKNIILQKTLDSYLSDYVSSYEASDFVISDEIFDDIKKPVCLATFKADSDIKRPIHRESLFSDLAIFYENINRESSAIKNVLDISELKSLRQSLDSINSTNSKDIDPLKEQIDNIFADFANKLYDILKKNQ